MAVAPGRSDLRDALAGRPDPVGVVMTMGALHDGHAALIDAARKQCATVVVTIFVNPLQFGAGEDLDRYPRTLEADLAVCREHGADVVFTPAPDVVYPDGTPQVTVHPGQTGEILEGAIRPGHFAGVLTVVNKLLHLVPRTAAAFFGEKDYQQLVLVRRMVRDLDLGVDIVAVPTVREPDGLARSSRNRYLSTAEHERALALSRALRAGQAAQDGGSAAVLERARAEVHGVDLDYLELTGPELEPAPEHGAARLLIAARVGTTRLIDNVAIDLAP
ncbi:MAG TPA: pantoate--beta-alanine ligase [Mycobacteriales bacterium]|nr:pantoate--beta-alanine ligase [Mycobacteriales bacterium]